MSLGVDTYGADPLSDLAVTDAAYHPAGLAVAALDRPLVVVQEGGYDVDRHGRPGAVVPARAPLASARVSGRR